MDVEDIRNGVKGVLLEKESYRLLRYSLEGSKVRQIISDP